MNNIFMGSYTIRGLLYDFSGIWSRREGKVEWKAVVRHADVVCRPSGTIHDEPSDSELIPLLKSLVRQDIEHVLERR